MILIGMTADLTDRELEAELDLQRAAIVHSNGLATERGRTRVIEIDDVLRILRDPTCSLQEKHMAKAKGKEIVKDGYMP
jgi:hypothetical protein